MLLQSLSISIENKQEVFVLTVRRCHRLYVNKNALLTALPPELALLGVSLSSIIATENPRMISPPSVLFAQVCCMLHPVYEG